MKQLRLTAITPSSIRVLSRRDVLRGLASAGLGSGVPHRPDVTAAKRKHRKGKNKDNKHKKHQQAQQPSPIARTVRQSVTRTFTNSGRIAIPDDSDMVRRTSGKANPYPSAIEVSGFTNGVITDVNLTLNHLTHTAPLDIDVLLTKHDGPQALVMSDISSVGGVRDVDLTLDDEAETALLNVISGTFKPNNRDRFLDTFDAPAPTPSGNVALSTFDGADPNGTWQLWVMDNATDDVGEIGGGWSLEITAEVDVQVQDPAQTPATNNDGKHHKRTKEHHGAKRREG